ncbi:hypothetical protein ATY41_11860 [Leifsonia xyli subsp. xyli]|uniref:Glycerol-3-phosphate ABC transporter, receptor protein n=2 Tax=Leifsonia xyli subsp. xyli TaxID=59736 RepID=Q6AGF0_LEIXX|nr:extracellular solute-binding protein [Leifsonia xyli]AAT88545.1 glycerol-3-phosphate ABC transporter, receptor protein [Leifsonia xyli subsp. xyli str. CTCB07]ODA89903.1 hypothetical protein ATY41_11860 [Leifsonia xyli subsp. xyli]
MNRKLLSIAAAATMTVALAACTSLASGASTADTGGAHGPSALKNASGTTEITIWHGLGAANGIALQQEIDTFNSTNKDRIHVTVTYQGVYADLLAKYTAAIKGHSTPTIVLAGDIATGFMTDVKQSIPAAEMAKANPSDLQLADLAGAARNYYTVGGVQQAVPLNVSTPMLWVNRSILRQAGIADSAPLNTLDQVVAAAKQIKSNTGIAGFSMPDDDWYIEQLTAAAAQARSVIEVVDAEGAVCAVVRPADGVDDSRVGERDVVAVLVLGAGGLPRGRAQHCGSAGLRVSGRRVDDVVVHRGVSGVRGEAVGELVRCQDSDRNGAGEEDVAGGVLRDECPGEALGTVGERPLAL